MIRDRAVAIAALKTADEVEAVVDNNATRLDDKGQPLNAHQGSMIRGVSNASGRYYIYGDWFRSCNPQGYGCRCVGDQPGMKVDGIGIYSTSDFKSWREEGGGGQLFNGFNQPRVAYFPKTGHYHMYLQFPLRLATSNHPAGPFELQKGVIKLDSGRKDGGSGDINVFVDAEDGAGYIIFTSGGHDGGDNKMRVQRLSGDGRAAIGKSSVPFPPRPVEAPLLFSRAGIYYALFGHNCPCCPKGSELFVYTAAHPLGPWTGGRDVNMDVKGKRVVNGQSAFVVPVGGMPGERIQYMWATD